MHVLFVEPAFPYNQRKFVRALKDVGAYVTGIGERPAEYARRRDAALARRLRAGRARSSTRRRSTEAVQRVQERGPWVDRLEATVEAHIMPAAKVREARSIPGTSVRTAWLCRDKPAMKEALRAGGVPCAQSTGTSDRRRGARLRRGGRLPADLQAARAAPAPPARCASTTAAASRARSRSTGSAAAARWRSRSSSTGTKGSTTRSRSTASRSTSSSRTTTRTSSTRCARAGSNPQIVATNRVEAEPTTRCGRSAARSSTLLGIGTSATHMEWFFGPKGLKFSEIGCRPPGVGVWDLYTAANDMDVYREWAHAIVHGGPGAAPVAPLRRRHDQPAARARRPDRRLRGRRRDPARVRRVDPRRPPPRRPALPPQPVEAGYMANAWIRMRHPDYDRLREMLDWVGRTVKVRVA